MTTATKNGLTTKPADEGAVTRFVPFGAKDEIKLSVAIVREMICVPSKSGKLCTEVQAIKFIALCKARCLNPFEGDAYLIGFDKWDDGKLVGTNFSLITAHQAFLKRAELHPEYDGMRSGTIVRDAKGEVRDQEGDFIFDDDILLGAWATVHFRTRSIPMHKRAKLSTYAKKFGVWLSDPAGMIVKVAEADALRSSFPTMLGGMYLNDELASVTGDIVTVAAAPPARSISDRIMNTDPVPEQPPVAAARTPDEWAADGEISDDKGMQTEHTPAPTTEQQALCDDLLESARQAKTLRELQKVVARAQGKFEELGPMYATFEAAYQEMLVEMSK